MGLSTDKIGGGNGLKVMEGVYAVPVKIKDITLKYNEKLFDEVRDVVMEIQFDIGKDFYPKFTLSGNYEKSADGKVKGWGTAFTIARFIKATGVSVDTDDNGIFQKSPEPLVGKEIIKVDYVSGTWTPEGSSEQKPNYKTWMTFFAKDTPLETIRSTWEESLLRGYPKNYTPEVVKQVMPATGDNPW